MSNELREFLVDLTQEVAALATANGQYTRTVFVENLVKRVIEAEEIQDWIPAFFDGRGHRRKALAVDGYCADELDLDGTLQLIIAELGDGTALETISTTQVNAVFERAIGFLTDAREGRLHAELEPSTPAADLASLIYEARERIRTVRVLVLTNSMLGTRFKATERRALAGAIKVELHVWDLLRFQQLAGSGGREEIDIDLTALAPDGIPALPAGIGETEYKAYLCVVPGNVLADVYERFGSRILEGNVRAFLSARGKVNQGMRKTILAQPERFFAFNNGITATASRIARSRDGNIIRICDLQIVNGGQTTASLFNTRLNDKASLTDIYVQMKLSVLPPELAMGMIPEISRFANTQNKVSDADLFANHPFNRRVEELSRRLWASPRPHSHQMTHWFYERARAQYQTEQIKLSAAQKRAFLLQNPKDQVITKTDLAKYENSYRCLPHVVSLGAQKNFIKFAEVVCASYDTHPDEFNERWFQHLVAKAIIFSAAERVVSAAPWYTNAYRANIVTYGIAKLVQVIGASFPGYVLDLDEIWRAQGLSDPITDALEVCAKVAHEVLLSPPQAGANITEWAKRKDCWERVAECNASPAVAMKRALRRFDDEREEKRRARGQEREEKTINATVDAMERNHRGFWGRAVDWRGVRKLLSPLEMGIVETAASRGVSWVPTDAQAKRLLAAARKLEEDGLT